MRNRHEPWSTDCGMESLLSGVPPGLAFHSLGAQKDRIASTRPVESLLNPRRTRPLSDSISCTFQPLRSGLSLIPRRVSDDFRREEADALPVELSPKLWNLLISKWNIKVQSSPYCWNSAAAPRMCVLCVVGTPHGGELGGK